MVVEFKISFLENRENIKLLVKNVDGYSIMFLTDNQELSVILVFLMIRHVPETITYIYQRDLIKYVDNTKKYYR